MNVKKHPMCEVFTSHSIHIYRETNRKEAPRLPPPPSLAREGKSVRLRVNLFGCVCLNSCGESVDFFFLNLMLQISGDGSREAGGGS